MNLLFENLIESYLDQRLGSCKNFISDVFSQSLRERILFLCEEGRLRRAGIGHLDQFTHDESIRRDEIFWLDYKNQDSVEDQFLKLMDDFMAYLNQTCFAGLVSHEFHFAYYEKGAFYKRHIDQFKNQGKRAFTFVLYLNFDWQAGDCGELKVYLEPQRPDLYIAPVDRQAVFFRSDDLEHEVLITNRTRMSVTGWFKIL